MKYKELETFIYMDYTKKLYEEKYNDRFNSESTYKFNFSIKNNQAFVFMTIELVSLISELNHLDKIIKETIKELPCEAILEYQRNCLIDEIKMTNEIEGIYSTRKEISTVLDENENKKKRKKMSILNGLVAKYAKLIMNKRNIIKIKTSQDVRALYDEIVLDEVIANDPDDMPDGKVFRAGSVQVTNNITSKHFGITPESELIKQMDKALDILNDEQFPLIIRIASFHYIFCYLHPFYNGNGRMTRFISSAALNREYNELVSFRLAYTIKENRDKYYKMFDIVNEEKNKGDITPFCIMFLEIVKKSMIDLKETLKNKISKYNYYIDCLKIKNKNKVIDDKEYKILNRLIIAELFAADLEDEIKGITINKLSEKTEISESTLRNKLKLLNEKNIISYSKDSKRNIYHVNLDKIEN